MATFAIKEKTFSLCLVGIFFIVVASMAAFNFSVNAFGVFPMKTIKGYNDVRFIENARIYKTFFVKNHPVDGLLLGSSRIEESMDPLPSAWPAMQVYNMAMPGASLHEMLRNLQHANAITPLKQVLIGFDFFMFSAFIEHVSDFSEDYFAVDEHGNKKPRSYVLRTYANILLSADAIEKSESTIKDSQRHSPPSHEASGMTSIAAHNAAIKDNAAIYKVFDAFEKTYFRKNGFLLNGPDATFTTIGKNNHSTYDDFHAILDYIYRNHINARFMISPIHERMYMGIEGVGLWSDFLQWKRQITQINEQIAAQYHQAPKPLWDFAVLNDLTRERLPNDPRLATPKNGMQWFWDPAHPKPAFGTAIQQRIFITGQQDIGTLLTSHTIEQHLQQQTAALARAKQEDPEAAIEIQKKLQSLNTWRLTTTTE